MKYVPPKKRSAGPACTGISTFLNLPYARVLEGIDFAIAGVPFDTMATFRPGTRFGPDAIRNAYGAQLYSDAFDLTLFDYIQGVDYGDVAVQGGYPEYSDENIKNTVKELALAGIIPIMVGAGTLISIPVLLQQYQLFNITSIFDHSYLMTSYLAGNLIATLIVILFAGYLGQAIAKQPGFALGLAGGIGMILNSIYLNNANAPGLLGGIIAGLLGGYLAKIMAKLMTKLPEDLASLHTTVIYPIFGMLITLAISYILSSYIGFVNQIIAVYISNLSIVGSLILGIVVAGMMAFDMGGPINKIAYIFGISQILEGNYDVMAAVMAGGMVPPLVIAIATTFFKHKFTNIQRKLGRKNYLQGLMFVSEGTLPFVKENRRLVTGVCMIASAMAGGFSMIYNCGISLPHGGIFVLPLVIHPIRYVVALLAGSLCGGMLYGIFKERESVN